MKNEIYGDLHLMFTINLDVDTEWQANQVLHNCFIGSVCRNHKVPLYDQSGKKIFELLISDFDLSIAGLHTDD